MSEEFFNSTLLTFVEDEVFDVSEQKLRYFSHKFINFSVLLSGMMFGQEKKDDVLGERVGFIIIGYMVFTIVLFRVGLLGGCRGCLLTLRC